MMFWWMVKFLVKASVFVAFSAGLSALPVWLTLGVLTLYVAWASIRLAVMSWHPARRVAHKASKVLASVRTAVREFSRKHRVALLRIALVGVGLCEMAVVLGALLASHDPFVRNVVTRGAESWLIFCLLYVSACAAWQKWRVAVKSALHDLWRRALGPY